MQFLHDHLFLAFAALLTAVALGVWQGAYRSANDLFCDWMGRRGAFWLAVAGFLLFYVIFYLTRPVFYTGYVGGTIGDNYRYVAAGVSGPQYFSMQHSYFPWFPSQLFHRLFSGFYDKSDPLYLEKAFLFFSFPARVFSLAGLGAFYWVLRRSGRGALDSFLGMSFFASTFGYWFWPIQCNAMGFLLPLLTVAICSTVMALQTRSLLWFALAGLSTSLCVYTHISCVYAVAALGLVSGTVCAVRYWKERTWNALAGGAVYLAVAGGLAVFYYALLIKVYGKHPVAFYVTALADHASLGGFSFREIFRSFLQDGIGKNAALLLGLLQAGGRPAWETGVIFAQVTAVLFLGMSVAVRARGNRSFDEGGIPWALSVSVFVACLVGYAARKTWFQYYVAIIPATTLVFLMLVLSSRAWKGRGGNQLALAVLIACNVLINGFSSTRVFSGEQAGDDPVYRVLSDLKVIAGEVKVLAVASAGAYPYNFSGIVNYYTMKGGRFSNIKWLESFRLEEAGGDLRGYDMILSDEVNEKAVAAVVPAGYKADMIQTGSPDVPSWVRWRRIDRNDAQSLEVE